VLCLGILSETRVVTWPIFLIVLQGLTMGRIGFIDDHFSQIASRLVFLICLPILLFTATSQINLAMTTTLVCVLFCKIVCIRPKVARGFNRVIT